MATYTPSPAGGLPRGPNGNLVFPTTLVQQELYFSFSFYKYLTPSWGGRTTGTFQDMGNVKLPMPNRMVDQQDIRFDEEKMPALLAAAREGVGATIQGAVGSALNSLTGGLGRFGDPALQLGGLAVNPFLTIMFKSPTFKKHQFSWKLTPIDEKESQDLNRIVDVFRYHQLPNGVDGAGGNFLLGYPDIVYISVHKAQYPGSGGLFSYWFKPAVLESVSVDFSPQGQPSFFTKNGAGQYAPTAVELKMSLWEIEYWLKDDYKLTGI